MTGVRILLMMILLLAAGCATPRPPAGLAMPAPDEAGAAALLAGYLLAQGWTVRLADEAVVDARRDGEQLLLEPLLDPQGLDRILVSRTWPRAKQVDDSALTGLAHELNEALNVGQFRVTPEGLVLQSSLAFIDAVDPPLLDAFLAFTAEVRFAVLQVQGERTLLAPVESGQASR